MTEAAAIAAVIRGYRFAHRDEEQLQALLAEVLEAAGFHATRETVIGDGCRIDLLVGRVGVEAKLSGSSSEVARQLRRYLATGALDAVVLVTRRVAHLRIPRILDDDRVLVIALPLTSRL